MKVDQRTLRPRAFRKALSPKQISDIVVAVAKDWGNSPRAIFDAKGNLNIEFLASIEIAYTDRVSRKKKTVFERPPVRI